MLSGLFFCPLKFKLLLLHQFSEHIFVNILFIPEKKQSKEAQRTELPYMVRS